MADEAGWTTEGVPEDQQFDYWCEVCTRSFFHARCVRAERGVGFRASLAIRRFGTGAISHIESDRVRVIRGEQEIARSATDGLLLYFQVRNTGVARQFRREVHLRPGDLALIDPMAPFELKFGGGSHVAVDVHLPARLVGRTIPRPHAACAERLDGDDRSLGSLLSALVGTLSEPGAQFYGAEQAVLEHVTGLLALALGVNCGPPAAGRQSVREALRSAALRCIARNLDDPGLTPGSVARRLGISVRYLHDLFVQHETSVERWILQSRLERAWDLLQTSRPGELTVSEVATRCGFTDLSYFSRAFRSRFGTRPRDLLRAS
jgi:AraC family transcriptional regulator, positive regulator of tynA and feaB